MKYENYVEINPKFIRHNELYYLCGDNSEAKNILNWKPEYTIENILDEMIEYKLNEYAEI